MKKIIPIIDLFAGPGGLGEGFSKLNDEKIEFKIALSIEKDFAAHKTLSLRTFVHQFDKPPHSYFDYLRGDIDRETLFRKHPVEAKAVSEIAWCHELKEGDIHEVLKRARKALKKFDTTENIIIGGPPCQAYSIMGRSRMRTTRTDFDDDPRHFLYRHYLRIVARLKPAIFIMENVKGITSAKVHGVSIFEKILEELSTPGKVVKELDGLNRAPTNVEYNIYSLVKLESKGKNSRGTVLKPLKSSDYVIKSEEYGIPQRRHRVILLCVRKDVDPELTVRLVKSRNEFTVGDVLNCFPPVRSGITDRGDENWKDWCGVISKGLKSGIFNSVDKQSLSYIYKTIKNQKAPLSRGAERFQGKLSKAKHLEDWYRKDCCNLEQILNYEPKRHMHKDIWRYLFITCFARAHGRTPRLDDFPDNLLPNHKNVIPSDKKNTKFIDRFKVQLSNKAATTVMSHISKDGHYYIHHDPHQCRAWTVREAARIQTFPDNYYFEGGKTAAYHQVGNAVPPYLALQIATVVAEFAKVILRK